jgi:hypothetical protein
MDGSCHSLKVLVLRQMLLPSSLVPFPKVDAFAFREHDRRGEVSARLSRDGKLELTEAHGWDNRG